MNLTSCPRCDAPISPEHRFCEQCGQPVDRDRVELTVRLGGAVLAGGVSDRGHRRKRNEDAMACGHAERGDGLAVVAVVCDGVASVQRGDEAAQAAARTASAALLSTVGDAADLRQATRDAIRSAADAVAALAHRHDDATGPSDGGVGAPSSTFVSAVVTGDRAVLGWVGDSRVYWLGEHSRCLTTDHALGGVLTRWLGADAGAVYPQVGEFEPEGTGAVVVCSDGLWNYLPDADQLAAVALPAGDPLAAAAALTQRALDAGGRDNVTAVVVPFPVPGVSAHPYT